MTRRRKVILVIGVALACAVGGYSMLSWLADAVGGGAGRRGTVPLPAGPAAIPPAKPLPVRDRQLMPTPFGEKVLRAWAEKPIGDWNRQAKVTVPRIMLAKLRVECDVAAVNDALQAAIPPRASGSTWKLGPLGHLGDYDFTETTLTSILYLFGDDPGRLYPKTVRHLLDVLLLEEGGRPRPMVPGSFGLVLDTENHHLMTEGCRYLKNQWLRRHGSTEARHNNLENGLEDWLFTYLDTMRREGVYEFNSDPYAGYTIQALLNLEAFAASSRIAALARYLLDTMNWQYALGSLDMRRFPPFRRQMSRADRASLIADPHTQAVRVWISQDDHGRADSFELPATHQAVIAAALPYRPPPGVIQWMQRKETDYLVRFGRGPGASPEIYSGAPGYVLSAGGVHRGRRSMIVARPTVLLLRDGATEVSECFHLPGQGTWRQWNNTGVYRRFACSNAPVVIPTGHSPVERSEGWSLYSPNAPHAPLVAVFNRSDLGLLLVVPRSSVSYADVMRQIAAANNNTQTLASQCTLPDGTTITYDPNAPKGTWPILTVNGHAVERNYDRWPRCSGTIPTITFDR